MGLAAPSTTDRLRAPQLRVDVTVREDGDVVERSLARGPKRMPSVCWYDDHVARIGNHVDAIERVDAGAFNNNEEFGAGMTVLRRAPA